MTSYNLSQKQKEHQHNNLIVSLLIQGYHSGYYLSSQEQYF
jgi:hypothetical protein